MLKAQGYRVEPPGQVPDDLAAGKDLADDGGQGGTGHAHIEAHDKHRIQHRVDHCAGQGADHGHLGAAVGPDQVAAAGGQHQEGEAKGGDAHIGLGKGQHVVR